MPLGELSEKQKHVSSYYGQASVIPASFDVALFTGNPFDDGVELDYPGYSRVTLTNNGTTFVADTDGTVTAVASFPDATDAAGTGSSVVTDDGLVWVMFAGSAIDSWDFLAEPIVVDAAGTIEDIEVTPYIPDDANVIA